MKLLNVKIKWTKYRYEIRIRYAISGQTMKSFIDIIKILIRERL